MATVHAITHARAEKLASNKLSTPRLLKRRPHVRTPFLQLPFVGSRGTKRTKRFWDVPATGGYFGGYKTGEAMALAFLKFLRADESEYPNYQLTQIVESFMVRFEEEGGEAMVDRRISDWSTSFDSLRGQHVGFFNTLSVWLAAAAKNLGPRLDNLTEQELVRRANAGLKFDSAAYIAELENRHA